MNNSITTPNETFGQSESTQAFAKLPKVFFDEKAPQYPQYKHLTAQHILAYTLMRDRLQLSITKQMKDENGTPFIYYDLENIASAVRCRAKKAGKLVDELDKAGLIHKVRQGLGKPNLIYVYDVLQASPSNRQFQTSPADSPDPSNGQSRPVQRTVQDQSNGQFKTRPTDRVIRLIRIILKLVRLITVTLIVTILKLVRLITVITLSMVTSGLWMAVL